MPADPIPLEQARRRSKRPPDEPPQEPSQPESECPVVALGHNDGKFYFLNLAGEVRCLTARALGARSELLGLFVGQSEWLEQEFPQKKSRKETVAGETVYTEIEVGFNAAGAASFLMREAGAAGIFGSHIVMRRPGIWADSTGRPAVHCGDKVMVGGEWYRAGIRLDNTIWVAGPSQPKPMAPALRTVGQQLESDFASLWTYRNTGSAMILIGILATGLLGAAAPWRPNGFITGGVGSGKSMLLDALAAAAPIHHYTNDTSGPGVTGAVNGRAMPIIIDEASDRIDNDGSGAQKLMDLVLAASRGDGVKGHRGTADGGVRTIEMAGSFIYGAVAPPELQPQHLARITVIDLVKPEGGADSKAAMELLIARCKAQGPALWGRMLACFDAWRDSVGIYRRGLAAAGCAPREQDQMSAILAGWWCLTMDGLPTEREVRSAIAQIAAFVRRSADVAEDDGPRRVVQHMLAQQLQYDGTTRREQVGTLLERAFRSGQDGEVNQDRRVARETLARNGIRPISDIDDTPNREAPRLSKGDGIWIAPQVARQLFQGSRFENDRWRTELLRLPRAGISKFTVRIAGLAGKAIWVSRKELDLPEPVPAIDLCNHLRIEMTRLLVLIDKYGRAFPIAHAGVRDNPRDPTDGALFDVSAVTEFLRNRNEITMEPLKSG